jgi:hypothetical protein
VIGRIAFDHGDNPDLLAALTSYQRTALDDIAVCGTEACGLHSQICDLCGDIRSVPNRCDNRSCPLCQGAARAAWVEQREAELLPCGYFHVVFTLPDPLRALARDAPMVVLGCLQRATADAVLHVAAQPRFLGAQVGILSVLHTWNRELGWHPHVHQIVTAGGLAVGEDGAEPRWVEAHRYGRQRRPFLAPVAVLRAAFQQRLSRLLLHAYKKGRFEALDPHWAMLASLSDFQTWLATLTRKPWCVHVEPPFGSPRHLLRYLGAYLNRAAITPQRILAYDPQANNGAGSVTFQVSRAREPGVPRTRTMTGPEFLRAFARHVLPPRLVRVRFRGLWATAHRRTHLERARTVLTRSSTSHPGDPLSRIDPQTKADHRPLCERCGIGHYQPYNTMADALSRPTRAERRQSLLDMRRESRSPKPEEALCTA